MSGRIILHIGTHKTATTHLQRSLSARAGELAEQGIWYPKYDVINMPTHYAHIGAVNALAGAETAMTQAEARRFFETVVQRGADFDTTIISAESLWRHFDDATGGDYWDKRKVFITGLAEIFPSDTTVAVVLRRQADFAHSFYQEHVKATRYTEDFETYRQAFWYHFEYLDQLRQWRAVFPSVVAMRFDDLIAGRPIEVFGAALGLDLTDVPSARHINPAWQADLTVLKRALNATGAGRKQLRDRVERLAGKLGQRKRVLYHDAADRRAFQSGFDAQNHQLKQEFFGTLSQGPLFEADFDEGVVFGDEMTPDFLASLVGLIN